MGSAKVSKTKPQTMHRGWNFLNKILHRDKKEKARDKKINDGKSKPTETIKPETTDVSILEPIKNEVQAHKLKTENEKHKRDEPNNEDDDELNNFIVKVIEEDGAKARIYSQSSQDSGFSDSNDVVETFQKLSIHKENKTKSIDDDDIENSFQKLSINKGKKESKDGNEKNKDQKKKNRKKETEDNKKKTSIPVYVKRGPMKCKVNSYNVHPYTKDAESSISQINKDTLSGGHLILNQSRDLVELDDALESIASLYKADPNFWEDVLDLITTDTKVVEFTQLTDTSNFPQAQSNTDFFPQITRETPNVQEKLIPSPVFVPQAEAVPKTAPVQQEYANPFEDYSTIFASFSNDNSMFPTPPRSENVLSPLSESQAYYISNSDYTLSPERSSPTFNSDFEKYQEISPISFDEDDKVKRDRTSSMTMKNFKDLQKEIGNRWSKEECCDINRESCKKIFEGHRLKLKAIDRKNLCFKVSKMDLKTAYGVLHHVLITLSKDCDQEDLHYYLFVLLCQRVMMDNPALFAGDFGLSILKAAALRCPHRPILTRYIVECVYLVLRSDPKLCANEWVFHEVDAQGDNLVIACARGGDAYALVLCEITRRDLRGELPPLFRLHHANSDGYTALHVACRMHSAASPRLHTVHVLLEHANADLWKGDIKAGDTPLHLAVISTTCCLHLIMMLFKHQDRKLWKKLAHAPNMSSVTPLENARAAVKSSTRTNYPHEVLDFLKKCR